MLAPFQPRGEHNPRHFDKLVWRLPIPIFDGSDEKHRRLVGLAERAEQVAAEVDVSGHGTFQAQRRLIREALETNGVSGEIDAFVVSQLEPDAAALAD